MRSRLFTCAAGSVRRLHPLRRTLFDAAQALMHLTFACRLCLLLLNKTLSHSNDTRLVRHDQTYPIRCSLTTIPQVNARCASCAGSTDRPIDSLSSQLFALAWDSDDAHPQNQFHGASLLVDAHSGQKLLSSSYKET